MANNQLIEEYFSASNGFGEHKNIAINLLKELINLLDKYQIEHLLISGTLLGYCRHKDFIPWDDDIDILVSFDFVKKLDQLTAELNLENKFKFCIQKEKSIYKFSNIDKIIPHKKY